jgi:hypothetical protein
VKAQYFLPESTADDLKFVYFPGVFDSYTGNPDQLVQFAVNTVSQKVENAQLKFPNGRRKREIAIDKDTGKLYEKYEQEAQEVGNEELRSDEDIFDDDFESDEGDEKMNPRLRDYPRVEKEDFVDTSGTRWLLYDGMGRMLTAKGFEGRYCVLRAICESAESNFGYHSGLFGQLFHILFTPSSTDDKIVNKDHYDYLKAEMLGKDGEPCSKIFYQCTRSIMEIFTQVYDSKLFKF